MPGEPWPATNRRGGNSVAGRAPRATGPTCRVHAYNNAHTPNPYFAVGAVNRAHELVEASPFDDVRFPTEREGGFIHSRGNVYRDITSGHHMGWKKWPEPGDPVFTPLYPCAMDPVEAVLALLRHRAGVSGPGEPSRNTRTDRLHAEPRACRRRR